MKEFYIQAIVNNDKLLHAGIMEVDFYVQATDLPSAYEEALSKLKEALGNEDDEYDVWSVQETGE